LDVTKKCLETVFAYTNFIKHRIVVSDNGSTDGTREWLQSLGDKIWYVENEKNLGFASAHNQIMRVFPFDDIVLMNNDIEVKDQWLEKLVNTMNEGKYGAVSPAIETPGGLDIGAVLDSNARGRSIINSGPEPHWITGSCLFIKRDTINKIGKLDERYFYYEDVDYCITMKRVGISFKCDTNVIIKHHNSASSNPAQKKLLMEESRKRFIEKWNWK
jgi:GT2 family glycosyltransferase